MLFRELVLTWTRSGISSGPPFFDGRKAWDRSYEVTVRVLDLRKVGNVRISNFYSHIADMIGKRWMEKKLFIDPGRVFGNVSNKTKKR